MNFVHINQILQIRSISNSCGDGYRNRSGLIYADVDVDVDVDVADGAPDDATDDIDVDADGVGDKSISLREKKIISETKRTEVFEILGYFLHPKINYNNTLIFRKASRH